LLGMKKGDCSPEEGGEKRSGEPKKKWGSGKG